MPVEGSNEMTSYLTDGPGVSSSSFEQATKAAAESSSREVAKIFFIFIQILN